MLKSCLKKFVLYCKRKSDISNKGIIIQMKKNLTRMAVCMVVFLCSGCWTRTNIYAGYGTNLKDSYTIYPTVELDIAAVTEAEADEIKKLTVEGYFSNDTLRKSIYPYTMQFSKEQTVPVRMDRDIEQWDKWEEKDPTHIVLIADMPRVIESKKEKAVPGVPVKDPRINVFELTSSWFWPRSHYFEIKPGRLVKIKSMPVDPEEAEKEKARVEALEKKKAEEQAKEEKKEQQQEQAKAKRKAERKRCRTRRCKRMADD